MTIYYISMVIIGIILLFFAKWLYDKYIYTEYLALFAEILGYIALTLIISGGIMLLL